MFNPKIYSTKVLTFEVIIQFPSNQGNKKSNFMTETLSRTDEGQPRLKYIFNKCGTNIYFISSREVWFITNTE